MKTTTLWKTVLVTLTFLTVINVSSAARAEWQFGIGTGLLFMNADGDMGFQVRALDTPIQFELDLGPDDFGDLMQSAFGFQGFASDGDWMILYSYYNLDLQGDAATIGPGGLTTINYSTEFEMSGAEVVVGYPVYRSDFVTFRLYSGIRYTGHELTSTVTTTGVVNNQRNRTIDEEWTDVLVGVMADVPIAEKWSWDTRFDGGYGGSEGTYYLKTELNWQFAKHWSAKLYGSYMAVDFENGTQGADDWYLYDVDESGIGLDITFNW